MVTESETASSLKVLLVADEKFKGPDFLEELQQHINGRSAQVEVFVIAPALASSGLEHELASFDEPIKEAGSRLKTILSELRDVGIEAVGEVGDGDPIVAIGDGLREFPADEIFVVGHAKGGERAYAEKDLWSRLHDEFHQPVVALLVGETDSAAGIPAVESIERDGAHDRTPEERVDEGRNFPKLKTRDIVGILFGVLGTLALGFIALDAANNNGRHVSGSSAAVLLLAIGAFLINVAHVVGLVFFQSVRYAGIWERFFAYMSVAYTSVALVLAVVFWQFWTW